MPPEFYEIQERIAQEKTEKYIGSANIRLDRLHFPNQSSRNVVDKRVDSLVGLFRESYSPSKPCNHIIAIIHQEDLRTALQTSKIASGALRDGTYPELCFQPQYRLHCLRGQHRVRAAKRLFGTKNTYWTVDLYSDSISAELKTNLTEKYCFEKRPNDGEFYRRIRGFEIEGSGSGSYYRQWWLVWLQ